MSVASWNKPPYAEPHQELQCRKLSQWPPKTRKFGLPEPICYLLHHQSGDHARNNTSKALLLTGFGGAKRASDGREEKVMGTKSRPPQAATARK
jgi:hypothetical protein